MPEITLEDLARRVEQLEKALLEQPPPRKDWRRVIGMFRDSAWMQEVDAECQRLREADRAASTEDTAE